MKPPKKPVNPPFGKLTDSKAGVVKATSSQETKKVADTKPKNKGGLFSFFKKDKTEKPAKAAKPKDAFKSAIAELNPKANPKTVKADVAPAKIPHSDKGTVTPVELKPQTEAPLPPGVKQPDPKKDKPKGGLFGFFKKDKNKDVKKEPAKPATPVKTEPTSPKVEQTKVKPPGGVQTKPVVEKPVSAQPTVPLQPEPTFPVKAASLPPGVKAEPESKKRFGLFKAFQKDDAKQPKQKLNLQDQQDRFIDDPTAKKRFSAFNQKVGNLLKDKKTRNRDWKIVGWIHGLILLFFIPLLAIMNKFVTLPAQSYPAVSLQVSINNALWGIAIFVIANIALPFITMFVLFLTGVRDVHASRPVHYFIWVLMLLNLTFLVISCCLLAAAYANLDLYNIWRNLQALDPNN
ncbi:MPN157 family protein [Mycoplasmoides pneumoniae]